LEFKHSHLFELKARALETFDSNRQGV